MVLQLQLELTYRYLCQECEGFVLKNIKVLVPIVLVVILLLSVYMLVNNRLSVKNEYDKYLADAREYASQGIAIDAAENYSKALEIQDSLKLSLEIGEFYISMEDQTSALMWGESLIEKYPKEAEAYEYLLSLYLSNEDYHRSFALIDDFENRKLSSKKITELKNSIQYQYYFGEVYEDVGCFSDDRCAVFSEGKWGYASNDGTIEIKRNYASVGAFSGGLAPVTNMDGEIYYIDKDGNKKVVIQNVKNVVELGSFASSCYPVFNGKTWAFYSTEYKKISKDYEFVSAMGNGVAAVMSNGYYTLIDKDGNTLSSNKFSDVVKDDKGIVYRNDVLFVNIDGLYYLVNSKGEKVSDKAFLSAKMFNDTTYAAVEDKNGWYFIDNTGKAVFDNLYFDDAHSFSNGYAAVKKNGLWGFINAKGELAIDYTFEAAKDFNSSGCVFVKTEDVWKTLLLYSENYDV